MLRKLQIPVKDIAAIFKSESTASLIQAFVDKLESLDGEITALSELRRLVDDFLHKMLMSGIKKISAITLLYEETEKRIALSEKINSVSFEKLSNVSREALKLHDIRVIRLPPVQMLTSRLKTGEMVSLDGGKMQHLFAEYGLVPTPGLRNCFYRKEQGDEWLMLMLMEIPKGFENTSLFTEESFSGGLFAVASSFMEDMDDTFVLLRDWINKSESFELDMDEKGILQRNEMSI